MCRPRSATALVTALLLTAARATGPRCKSQTNTNVDWWVIYKLPVLTGAPTGTAWRDGYGYAYMDSQNPGDGLVAPPPAKNSSLQDKSMALTYTLAQVYDNVGSSSVGYYLYNDEKPDGSSSSYRGHTKGVSVFDANGGFFLDHSVPRFPPAAEDAYEFPQNEATYGQSFMCVSGDSTALEVIFGQWLYTYPNDYSSNIPEALQSIYPNLVQVAAGKHVTSEPWTSSQTFATSSGLSVKYIAKYSTWGEDFWEDLVAPTLGVALYTETWQNGAGRLSSFCTSDGAAWDVENVLSVDLGNGADFLETQDHSKWGVTLSDPPSLASNESKVEANSTSSLWACVGDLNMQSGQESRAGGALCVQDSNLYNAYANLITSAETC